MNNRAVYQAITNRIHTNNLPGQNKRNQADVAKLHRRESVAQLRFEKLREVD